MPGWANADWSPDAVAVEVLFGADDGASYVVSAVGSSPQAAVATAEEEARRFLGCGTAIDWRAA